MAACRSWPPAPGPGPADGGDADSNPIVRAVLETFRGEIVSIEKPS
jgi:hypothetical protein